MALKFLNKKGWHTGSLRNIENVWKAEQKHEAEQRKLEELKKQIQDEREKQEFRLLQEEAGLVPKQERLEFLYDSGLSVGKSSTDEYLLGKPVEPEKTQSEVEKVAATPGALFVDEKPQSANDQWRKLHSDPLLLIRQQEQAALARIKNNPVKMEMIKKSIAEKISKKERKRKLKKEEHKDKKRKREKSYDLEESDHQAKRKDDGVFYDDVKVRRSERDAESSQHISKHERMQKSSSEWYEGTDSFRERRQDAYKYKNAGKDDIARARMSPIEEPSKEENIDRYRRNHTSVSSPRKYDSSKRSSCRYDRSPHRFETERHRSPRRSEAGRHISSMLVSNVKELDCRRREQHDRSRSPMKRHEISERGSGRYCYESSDSQLSLGKARDVLEGQKTEGYREDASERVFRVSNKGELYPRDKRKVGKLSEEEKAARLREMQMDAEVHEEQRWHRLKKASEADKLEEARAKVNGRNFLDTTARSIYGAEKGGSASVEESVRRRTHFIARTIGDSNVNTFQRL